MRACSPPISHAWRRSLKARGSRRAKRSRAACDAAMARLESAQLGHTIRSCGARVVTSLWFQTEVSDHCADISIVWPADESAGDPLVSGAFSEELIDAGMSPA